MAVMVRSRAWLLLAALLAAAPAAARDCVVLLHGLGRGEGSMLVPAAVLAREGYRVVAAGYDAADGTVEAIAAEVVPRSVAECGEAERIHFVTHSMGAIVLRAWMEEHQVARLGRTVMMAPPNRGSEVVDALRGLGLARRVVGPAGEQLGAAAGLPARLGPVWPGVGVIAGTRSGEPWSSALIPGPDDGKVSVASTRVAGMDDHLVLRATHTFVMNHPVALAQTVAFLRDGVFARDLDAAEALRFLFDRGPDAGRGARARGALPPTPTRHGPP